MIDDEHEGIMGGFISRNDIKAARVCRELQNWLCNVEGTSSTPIVALTITDGMTSIEIGNIVVWCSETDFDDLTFEFCQGVFQDEIIDLTHYGRVHITE